MNIKLKERQEEKLSELVFGTTFKIPESCLVFMKIDVEGLTTMIKQHPDIEGQADPKSLKVQIPEGKAPVVCLNTGKTQFLLLSEKVEIVELDAIEILKESKCVV